MRPSTSHAHPVCGDAVEEIDGSVDGVDDPADAAGHGRGTAVFFAEDRVTRPQGGHQAADQRLRFAVDDGDRVDAAGFDASALRSTAADAQFEAAGADVVGGRGGQKDRHGAEIVDVAGEGGFGGVVVHGAIVPLFV